MMAGSVRSQFSATITSDASGSWGCGAFIASGEWLQFEWPDIWEGIHITVKEMLPIVMAVAMWGDRWPGETVRCLCDNAAVVAVVNSGTSKCERVMHLMRCLFFFAARHNITLVAQHIPGVLNKDADALSRNDHRSFLSQNPGAHRMASVIPQELVQALVLQRPDWTSQNWIRLLAACSPRAWQTPPSGCTGAARTDT